jgi:hypothetical protein
MFLLVVDCLSLLVKNYERQGLLSRIKVCRRSPSITHLLFVDDSILLFHLDGAQARCVRELLGIFERSTCQKLSLSK